jgi:hypothetical protein
MKDLCCFDLVKGDVHVVVRRDDGGDGEAAIAERWGWIHLLMMKGNVLRTCFK